jgi:hypothetical protein
MPCRVAPRLCCPGGPSGIGHSSWVLSEVPVGVELKANSKFGSGGPLRNHVGNECGSGRQRKQRSLHHVELICSAPKPEVIRCAGNTRSISTIRQWWLLANWARLSNPSDCPAPGLHPNGAAAMPEIMPDRQHTMRAVAIGAFASAPDVGAGALGRRPASSADFAFRFRIGDSGQPQFQTRFVFVVEWVQPVPNHTSPTHPPTVGRTRAEGKRAPKSTPSPSRSEARLGRRAV